MTSATEGNKDVAAPKKRERKPRTKRIRLHRGYTGLDGTRHAPRDTITVSEAEATRLVEELNCGVYVSGRT